MWGLLIKAQIILKENDCTFCTHKTPLIISCSYFFNHERRENFKALKSVHKNFIWKVFLSFTCSPLFHAHAMVFSTKFIILLGCERLLCVRKSSHVGSPLCRMRSLPKIEFDSEISSKMLFVEHLINIKWTLWPNPHQQSRSCRMK